MALIRGVMSNFPCPICLIPREQISNFPDPYPLRTRENVVATLEKARSQQSAEEKEAILAAEGLRNIDVSNWLSVHLCRPNKFDRARSTLFRIRMFTVRCRWTGYILTTQENLVTICGPYCRKRLSAWDGMQCPKLKKSMYVLF